MIRDGSWLAAFPKCAFTFQRNKLMENEKETRRCRGESLPTVVLYSFLELLMPETQTEGVAAAQTLTWAQIQPQQGVPAKETLSFNCSPTQFPLPLPQPAITPQSQGNSSLYTRLPPEGRSRTFTCVPRLPQRHINFHFCPKETTFSLSYWMLQWLHLKSWAFSSIPLARVMQSLSFQITQCICNQTILAVVLRFTSYCLSLPSQVYRRSEPPVLHIFSHWKHI